MLASIINKQSMLRFSGLCTLVLFILILTEYYTNALSNSSVGSYLTELTSTGPADEPALITITPADRLFINQSRAEPYIERLMSKNRYPNKIDNRKDGIGGVVIVTISNYGFREFVVNWIHSLKKNKFSKFVVFCYDETLLIYLKNKGYESHIALVPRSWVDHDLSTGFQKFGNVKYTQIVQSKTNVWYELLKRGHTYIFSDPDVVFLSEHVVKHVMFDFANSFAHVMFSREPALYLRLYNTGFFVARPTQFVKELFMSMIEKIRANNAMEQHVLNDLMGKSNFNDQRVGGLDLLLYSSGNLYFKRELNDRWGIKPLVVHATYFSGRSAKIGAFKSKNLWNVE
jgi:hypothetical protein